MTPPERAQPPKWAEIEQAFDHAMDLADDARQDWLEALAQRDPALARCVLDWITHGDDTAGVASGPVLLADDLVNTHDVLPAGTRMGSWRILELLGSGGMGRVYLAERADGAFDKRVALKVLRHERNLPDEVLRHERALLARLEHPGVTRLLDGGVDDEGNLYLVMELVHGQTLRSWCLEHGATLDDRLGLFVQVADTIAYAHRNLIVHGDIKPGNVLVEPDGRARLLDFGIARLASESARANDTRPPALTPAFASPECRDGAMPSVFADVYSLGALLKFMLREPATKTRNDTAGSDQQDTSSPHLPRDLAAIITTAMAADPSHRYRDVPALCRDLDNFRQRRPVTARAGGVVYRTHRFVRRHWLATGATTILVAVLLTAGTVVAEQNRMVRAERDRAQLEVARSQTVLEYLIGVLGEPSHNGAGVPPSVREQLANSLEHFDRDFAGDPAARQLLLSRLGELHIHLDDYATAETLLTRFLDAEHGASPVPVRARVFDNLALIRLHQGQLPAASSASHKAQALLESAVSDTRALRSEVLVTRARIQRRKGAAADAVQTLRQALTLRLEVSPANSPQTVVVRNSLAVALMRAGRLHDALDQFALLDAALQSSQRDTSPDAANIYNNYASVSFAFGRYDQASKLFAKALRLQKDLYGPSAGLAALLNNYGKLKLALGDIDAGTAMIEDAVAMMQRYAGNDSIDLQLVRASLGDVALARGQPGHAESLYQSVRRQLSDTLGADHPLTTRLRTSVLTAKVRGGKLNARSPAFGKMFDALAESSANYRPLATLHCLRAEMALAQRALEIAAISAQTCLSLRQASQSIVSPSLFEARFLKAETAIRQGNHAAIAARTQSLDALRDVLGEHNRKVVQLQALVTDV